MSPSIQCPNCGLAIVVIPELVGKSVGCPKCRHDFVMTEAATEEPPMQTPERVRPAANDADAFDPYHTWLGIPPSEQPPNHYRLLGIAKFESHSDVIENAAHRQIAHLRSVSLGPRMEYAQELLNKVASAQACLLNPDRRAEYDRRLRVDAESQAANQRMVAPPWSAPVLPMQPVIPPTKRKAPQDSKIEVLKIIIGGVVGLAAGFLILAFLLPESVGLAPQQKVGPQRPVTSRQPAPSRNSAANPRRGQGTANSIPESNTANSTTNETTTSEPPPAVVQIQVDSDRPPGSKATPVESESKTSQSRPQSSPPVANSVTPPPKSETETPPTTKGPSVDSLTKQLLDPSASVRVAAARELVTLGPDAAAAIPQLTEAAQDASHEVRFEAVRALGAIGPEAKVVVPKLARLLDDEEDERVREAVVNAILQIDRTSPEMRKILRWAIVGAETGPVRRSQDATIKRSRVWACKTIATMGEDAVWADSLLEDLLRLASQDIEREIDVFIETSRALGAIGGLRSIAILKTFTSGKAKSKTQYEERAIEAADAAIRTIRKRLDEKPNDPAGET